MILKKKLSGNGFKNKEKIQLMHYIKYNSNKKKENKKNNKNLVI